MDVGVEQRVYTLNSQERTAGEMEEETRTLTAHLREGERERQKDSDTYVTLHTLSEKTKCSTVY